ncbi:hypothetical protein E2C01_075232 [Portunus trituberculatus]|uniref:Uncharacterized protein n=1 Tax=Portunus trituberculatus TaxID=210409 RepID=A0A5B7IFA9_PORTR|nr:hypothetical protein [Portunus trituberculatus]
MFTLRLENNMKRNIHFPSDVSNDINTGTLLQARQGRLPCGRAEGGDHGTEETTRAS